MPRKLSIKIGDKFNNLTVISRAEDHITSKGKKCIQWHCRCDCGNKTIVRTGDLKNGKTKSCGCFRTQYNHSKGEDLANQKFGMLTVISKAEYYITPGTGKKYVQWNCRCDCGNETIVTASALKQGSIKSCGCFRTQWKRPSKINDLTNQRFGNLEVLSFDELRNHSSYWKCKCDCGNIVSVRGTKLTSGWTKSCGCIKSQGEQKIIKLLNDNNIQYVTQKVFNDCPIKARFDFYIENKYIIEYDGEQHYNPSRGWNDESNFVKNMKRDMIKNQYCIDNKIPLIRIPYTHFNDLCIEDLQLDTSNFIYYI